MMLELASRRLILGALLGLMMTAGVARSAAADDLQAVFIRDKPFSIYGSYFKGHAAYFNGNEINFGQAAASAGIRTVIAGGGHTYVVTAGNCGGSSCGERFRFIDVTTDVPVSNAPFGTGNVRHGPFEVVNGAAHVRIPRIDGQGSEGFTYIDDHLTT